MSAAETDMLVRLLGQPPVDPHVSQIEELHRIFDKARAGLDPREPLPEFPRGAWPVDTAGLRCLDAC